MGPVGRVVGEESGVPVAFTQPPVSPQQRLLPSRPELCRGPPPTLEAAVPP